MDQSIKEFVKTYTSALEGSTAAIFAGAGLSKPAGYVNWKELLREIAEEIDLDIDKETDLISIAQYHVNENKGDRNKVNQLLINEFYKDGIATENHKVLSRLPIKTYWTTNYDSLIEDNLRKEGKKVDVKISKDNLSITIANADSVVYKMHGDISQPHEAVITKDDYESYNTKRQLFTTALQGDLVSKTLLFIGFSFDDPNLDYILSRIRILLDTNKRTHYCFMKKVKEQDFKKKEEFIYSEVKQKLKSNDLRRYGIKVIFVNDYEEITKILQGLESYYKRKNIFISGSAHKYGNWSEQQAWEFASQLSKEMIKNGNNIVTGFGLGIGSCIIAGALEEIYETHSQRVEERLISRPFPQNVDGKMSKQKLWSVHRENMIKNVGIALFIFGNKIDTSTNTLVDANGMIEEYEICLKQGVIPIPIGKTGYIAEKLWEKVLVDMETFIKDKNLIEDYNLLNDKKLNNNETIKAVISLINKLEKRKK